jgi:hypothetical protein
MWKLLLTSVVAAGWLAIAPQTTWAADIEALEQGSGQCGAQANCLVPDAGWDVAPFTTTTQVGDTVTGSGVYVAGTNGQSGMLNLLGTGSGSASVYLTEPDGTTVTGIFSITYSGMFGLEAVAATWETDGGDPGDLGPLPAGAVSVVETGGLQDITSDLEEAADGDALPNGLSVQVEADLPVAEPASLALLSAALLGLTWARRRRPAIVR